MREQEAVGTIGKETPTRALVRTVVAVVLVAGLGALLVAGPALAGGPTILTASLTGAEEVPGPGDADGSATAEISLDAAKGTVCFTLDWKRIRSPFAAHIHRGTAGVAGPVRVPLFEAAKPLPATITGIDGCVRDVDSALIQRIIDNPDRYYVNIHNKPYPSGALRGQLTP